ncbi:MAG: hypothetical protein HYX27_27255 [Acidobacteria bacterium]|nr:hypothetical protein [Acidobacteriota bacterium]
MSDETHHTEYNFDADKECFFGDNRPLDIDKGNGNRHKVLVHNRSSFKTFDFEYVVCSAVVTHTDGTSEHLDPATVFPFTERERRGQAGAHTAAEYTVSPMIGNDPEGKIVVKGAFQPLNPCVKHDPCHHHGPQTRTHTDWHIEC